MSVKTASEMEIKISLAVFFMESLCMIVFRKMKIMCDKISGRIVVRSLALH